MVCEIILIIWSVYFKLYLARRPAYFVGVIYTLDVLSFGSRELLKNVLHLRDLIDSGGVLLQLQNLIGPLFTIRQVNERLLERGYFWLWTVPVKTNINILFFPSDRLAQSHVVPTQRKRILFSGLSVTLHSSLIGRAIVGSRVMCGEREKIEEKENVKRKNFHCSMIA